MAKKQNKPTIKADDFVEYEDAEKPETFTNFQELKTRVGLLQEKVDKIVEILRANYFDENEVYKRLDDEE